MAASTSLRNPLKARTYSPGQHLLSPNDDATERARLRAARAAAQRRTLMSADFGAESSQEDSNLLNDDAIAGLLESCLKLAAENKINQQNTWELPLIDHLSDVFKNNHSEDLQCNFQKASCGLEAGIKIYATRVDSVHSQAFKVLGGLSRNSNRENAVDDDAEDNADAEDLGESMQKSKDGSNKKGESTLAPTFESLNVKKFDVAFAVDPLFHLTSAQFDEGGAKGLLLNTLSVYGHCELVFDSLEIPERKMKAEASQEGLGGAIVDLSSMKDMISEMVSEISKYPVISPTLHEILRGIDDPVRRAAEAESSKEQAGSAQDWAADPDSCSNDNTYVDREDSFGEVLHQNGYDDMADNFSAGEEGSVAGYSPLSASVNGDDGGDVYDEDADSPKGQGTEDDEALGWLVGKSGHVAKSNAWAGPDHWKFRRADDPESDTKTTGKETKKSKKSSEQFVVNFNQKAEVDVSRFAAPKDPSSTTKRYNLRASTLAQRRTESATLLPEDCHYQALDLVQLFLRPIVHTRKSGKKKAGTGSRSRENVEGMASTSSVGDIWDEAEALGAGGADDWDDGSPHSDVEDPDTCDLVAEPRKVQKVSVNYERTSKQVDVHSLKESMWRHLQEKSLTAQQDSQQEEPCDRFCGGVSFQDVLQHVAEERPGGDSAANASVALCLICLLHLANEHGLSISHSPSLDEVVIL